MPAARMPIRSHLAALTVAALVLTGCAPPSPDSAGSATVPAAAASTVSAGEVVVVYRSPTCDCCSKHIAHLRAAGFEVRDEVVDDLQAVKDRLGIVDDLQSCHTSMVGDYFVEGHVPADVVERLLVERPDIDGVALPGMPAGAPGMPGGPEPLTVLAVDGGQRAVFAVR